MAKKNTSLQMILRVAVWLQCQLFLLQCIWNKKEEKLATSAINYPHKTTSRLWILTYWFNEPPRPGPLQLLWQHYWQSTQSESVRTLTQLFQRQDVAVLHHARAVPWGLFACDDIIFLYSFARCVSWGLASACVVKSGECLFYLRLCWNTIIQPHAKDIRAQRKAWNCTLSNTFQHFNCVSSLLSKILQCLIHTQ